MSIEKMIEAMRQYEAAQNDACREHLHVFMAANKVSPETHLMLMHPTDIPIYWRTFLPEFVRLSRIVTPKAVWFVRRSMVSITGGPPL